MIERVCNKNTTGGAMTTTCPPFSSVKSDLAGADKQIRRTALQHLLHWYRPQALDTLQDLLQDKRAVVRVEAIKGLQQLGDPQAIPALHPLLTGRPYNVSNAVIGTLVHLKDPHLIAHLT